MNEEQNKLLGLERLILIQALAESYLFKQTAKSFSDVYPDAEHGYGVLTVEHIEILRKYLKEHFEIRGMDLDACLEKAGEKALPDKLTDFESTVLVNVADDVLFTHYAVEKLKEKFLKK